MSPAITTTGEASITDVLVMLARLEGKLDAMSAEHSTRLSNSESDIRDLDARLRGAASEASVAKLDGRLSSVEKKVWSAAGIGTVVAMIAGPLITHFINQ